MRERFAMPTENVPAGSWGVVIQMLFPAG